MLHKANIKCSNDSSMSICHSCLQGKFFKLPFHSSNTKSVNPFHTIHNDLWGPSPSVSADGFRYYITFIDEFTRYCWLFHLVNKSDLCSVFVKFHQYVHTQFSCSIKILQTDGGGEYVSKQLQSFLHTKGIIHQKSCPYTPEQNDLAERKHRHLIETTITLLQHAKIPTGFWSYAVHTAAYLINRMPSVVLQNKSPYEVLFHTIPVVSHLRVFGCACYPLLQPCHAHKLQLKTIKCVFLGYASQYKGYTCYDVVCKCTYISRHVIFDELDFPYATLSACVKNYKHNTFNSPVISPVTDYVMPCSAITSNNVVVSFPLVDTTSQPHVDVSSSPVPPSPSVHTPSSSSASKFASAPLHSSPVASEFNSESSLEVNSSSADTFRPEAISVVLHIPDMNVHSMQTRSKSGILKKKAYSASVVSTSTVTVPSVTVSPESAASTEIEPSSYKIAMRFPVWVQAMYEEIEALRAQGTWTLESLPCHKNLVGCKWIFKIKRHANGSIARYKARLVSQGFSQEPGIDYGETFSLVVKPTTVRVVLALAAHFGWVLRQLDV